jgi:hypothetical protein
MTRRSRLAVRLPVAILLAAQTACASAAQTASGAVRIPGRMEGGLFIAEPVTARGERLRFRVNTGSGPALIYPDVAQRLGLAVDSVLVESTVPTKRATRVPRAPLPAFRPDASIPAPLVGAHAGHLMVSERGSDSDDSLHGYLGNPWFARRTWTFDYRRGRLLLRTPGDLPRVPEAHRVRLGFRTRGGEPVEWLPRIRVEIDGDSLDLLLATGADDFVSEQALREMGLPGPSRQPLSAVTQEVFQRWRTRHPEWRVIERAVYRDIFPVIEVPEISVGGHRVGPVWFSGHGAGAEWLSNWTDLPVRGWLGGNALRFFTLTLDMDQGIAVFERH